MGRVILLRNRPGRTTLLVVVVILLVVLSLELAWSLAIAPRLRVRRIRLESDLPLPDDVVLALMGVDDQTWLTLDEEVAARGLEAHPLVRKALVEKEFPDSVRVILYGRRPLLAALVPGSDQVTTAIFDEEGTAYHIAGVDERWDLPVVTGVRYSDPLLGARLPSSLHPLLTDLARVKREDALLFSLISEIAVVPRIGEDYELTLYLSHIPVPLRMGGNLDVEKLRRAVMVLDILASSESGRPVKEADLRSEQVVYRYEEEI